MVGDYRIVAVLGQGGFGIVYKVERAGLFFALKLLRARALEGWGQREINILRHLAHPNVVGFHGYDRWPVPVYGYLYFVMDFVEGRTLEDWALDENPSARQVARILHEVFLALAAVHAQGVFHRDLKRDNLLIRDSDSRPILVDFGIGWLAGEPTVTRNTLPPGTSEYRSPEALRFEREPANSGARYRPDEGDDVWALAVTFYWLLTDVLPFGSRHEGGLNDRILTRTPKAPHEVNARVPEALSHLCMRMLEKERSARFPGSAELCGALEAALAGAELDGRWDLPLLDPDAPDKAPTAQDPDKAPRDDEALEVLQWNVARPRRGRKAAHEHGPVEEKRTPPVDAPAPAQAPQAPAQAPQAPARTRTALTPMAHLAVRVVALVVLAGAGAFVVQSRRAPATPSATVPTATPTPGALLLHGWLPECPTPRACPLIELATSPETVEAGAGAAPLVPSTPALATAMPIRKQEPRPPPQEKPAPARSEESCVPSRKWQCLAASCGWVLVSCTGGPQVRATPGPEDCPADAVRIMEGELDLPIGTVLSVSPRGARSGDYVTVRGGRGAVELAGKYGELGKGTLLTGDFILGEKILYGRFKQAQTPGGKVYPVCMEFLGRDYEIKANVGTDAVKVHYLAQVRAVDTFE